MTSLYHYCKMNIMKKILTNKTIRFSDVRQSNDCDEMVYSLISYFVSMRYKKKGLPYNKEKYKKYYRKYYDKKDKLEELHKIINDEDDEFDFLPHASNNNFFWDYSSHELKVKYSSTNLNLTRQCKNIYCKDKKNNKFINIIDNNELCLDYATVRLHCIENQVINDIESYLFLSSSFSTDGDSKKMWDNYAKFGVSIEFDKDELYKSLSRTKYASLNEEYNHSVRYGYNSIKSYDVDYDSYNKILSKFQDENINIYEEYQKLLEPMLHTKKKKWEDEKEHRFMINFHYYDSFAYYMAYTNNDGYFKKEIPFNYSSEIIKKRLEYFHSISNQNLLLKATNSDFKLKIVDNTNIVEDEYIPLLDWNNKEIVKLKLVNKDENINLLVEKLKDCDLILMDLDVKLKQNVILCTDCCEETDNKISGLCLKLAGEEVEKTYIDIPFDINAIKSITISSQNQISVNELQEELQKYNFDEPIKVKKTKRNLK